MADENDTGEKTEDPSAHRIDEFRKRGEVASSKELTSVLVLAACVLTLTLSFVFIYEELAAFVEWLYKLDVTTAYTQKSLKTIITKTVVTALICTAPVLLVALCIGVLGTVSQIGFLFSTEVLEFKPERLNPVEGVKKLFSMKSVVEAIKGLFKFAFILAIVYSFMKDDVFSYSGFLHSDVLNSFLHGKGVITQLGFAIILGMLIIAIFDFGYQKMSYKKKLMQTKYEVKKESKEQDGNPEVKQKIRQIQREMAQNRMLSDIAGADAIITNPTHISIILKFDDQTMVAPTVIGKGSDHLAMKIREIAKQHDIPIVENVPLARALYKTVKSGKTVPRTLYKAVAEVLAFVYRLKKKKKALA